MKVLVINAGSSSLKYQLIRTKTGDVVTKGLFEKIGGNSEYTYTDKNGQKVKQEIKAEDHTVALEVLMQNLGNADNGFIESLDEIQAVGHRVVHGGEEFSESVLIDEYVISSIEKYADLAPLHNPPNLQGIKACMKVLPNVKQVAVFDTAFHQTMPPESYIYPIPYEYYEKYGVRRYGFHGTSHRYVTLKTAEFLGKKPEEVNLITCHMGNGSSITAVKNGQSVDTSMGFTPLEGVMMGTRSGSIDPAIVFYLMEKENLSIQDMNNVLNKKSGLLGVSGVSNDLREIKASAKEGNKRAEVAKNLLIETVRRYIGAYMVKLGRVDAVIFTAGIGENESVIREGCISGLEDWGIVLDKEKNNQRYDDPAVVSTDQSKVKIMVVPTNEELMIAMDTAELI